MSIKNQRPLNILLQIYTLFLFRINLIKNINVFNIVLPLIWLLINAGTSHAQQINEYKLQLQPKKVAELASTYQLQSTYSDSTQLKNHLYSFIRQLHSLGYVTANLDVLHYHNQSHQFIANIHLGQCFSDIEISLGNMDSSLWQKFVKRPTIKSILQWEAIQKAVLTYSENTGHPFASIELVNLAIGDSSLKAAINFRAGPLIQLDSLLIEGESRVNASFLAHYIGWEIGKPYSEEKATMAIALLQQLPYLSIQSSPQYFFKYDSLKIRDCTVE